MAMRIVMDTDTIVAALRSPSGASAELLRRARHGELTLAASVSLFMEYESVCLRPEHMKAAGLDLHQVGVFLDGLARIAEPVEVHFLWRPRLRDPADELVLEAAVNASVQALLTFNLRHFARAVERFHLNVVLPGPFLRSLKK
jgi:putative PIN family toxin of toxin-antitoxin system